MNTIPVAASRPYEVKIGAGLLKQAGQEIARLFPGAVCAVITDTHVAPLYLQPVLTALRTAGLAPVSFVFPAGESAKCGKTYLELLEFLAQSRLTRSDVVVALGGGVTGDLAGFAAATYLRGVGLVQIPTTLLAAVDSSVGGKTAIDLAAGKNLAGAFYQPRLVLCDPDTLNTLPETVFSDGCAEVIKYGMLGSPELLDLLLQTPIRSQLEPVITLCVEKKRDLVQEDEFDTGRRQLLNLGHTVGHAIESLSGYTVSHGRAVATGMAVITRAAVKKGLCPPRCLAVLLQLLADYHLPDKTEFSPEDLYEKALGDKKRTGGSLNLVVPTGWGESRLMPMEISQLKGWIELGVTP